MQALIPTDWKAEIVWLGCVMNDDRRNLLAEPRDMLELTFDGIKGAHHAGGTRPSCSRVKQQYAKGTTIRNERQLSIISAEELAQVAETLGLRTLDPARLGATMVLKGIPDFTYVPPSARLQATSGATLVVDMENMPCQLPARSIENAHPGHGQGFKAAAKGKRGVTAWVTAEGVVRVGDMLTLHVPNQRAWAP